MTAQKSSNKKIAGVVGAVAILLGAAACTSTVDGTAQYVGSGAGPSSSESSSSSSSSPKSSSSSSSSSSASPTSSTSPNVDAAQAPGEAFEYNNGVKVTLKDAVPAEIGGTFDSEEGRIIPFTIENPSTADIDLSSTAYESEVTCDGKDMYIFPSEEKLGPDVLTAGQTAEYQMSVAMLKTHLGMKCTIVVGFSVDLEPGQTLDPATFEMTIN